MKIAQEIEIKIKINDGKLKLMPACPPFLMGIPPSGRPVFRIIAGG